MCRRAFESNGEMRTSRCTPELGLEPAIGVVALDQERRALDPGLLAVGPIDDVDLEAVLLGPAAVHALQHLGPVLALRAAGAGMDLEIGVVRIGLAGEQALDLAARGLGLDPADGGLAFPDARRVALGLAELDQRHGILEVLLEAPDSAGLVLERVPLAHDLLRRLGVVPEVRVLGLSVQLGEASLRCIPVKDASSAARSTAWRLRRGSRSRRA